MAQTDTIAVNIPAGDLDEMTRAIGTIKTKLLPHLQTLEAQERLELPKMGDKTVAFVQKSLEYAKQNPDLVPSFLDLPALETDLKAVQTLRELAQNLAPIVDALSDSMIICGSEAYQGALVFYNNVKNAVKSKHVKALTIYKDLAGRFPASRGQRKA